MAAAAATSPGHRNQVIDPECHEYEKAEEDNNDNRNGVVWLDHCCNRGCPGGEVEAVWWECGAYADAGSGMTGQGCLYDGFLYYLKR